MKRICPCFTPSRIALAEGARETVSLRGTFNSFFFVFSQTRDCTTFTLHYLTDFYVDRVTAHRIKETIIHVFTTAQNSKTTLKLNHLWEQGGPTQLAYSAYREDRLWPCPYMLLINFGHRRTIIQVGLKYAMEGHIKDFKINIVGINLEARVHRSQCKREKSHITVVTIADEKILDQHCSCTAGYKIILHLTSLIWRDSEM